MPAAFDQPDHPPKKNIPCRSCTDFKTWAKQQSEVLEKKSESPPIKSVQNTSTCDEREYRKDCPADKDELGRSTWTLLHTMAATYPEQPPVQQQNDMKSFITILSKYYPCEYCASDFRKELKNEPVKVTTQEEFSQWLCRLHNTVNEKLGKPLFDCRKVNERWRDGWRDGSCDI